MAEQKVNTEAIDQMALAIAAANNNINTSFETLRKGGTKLEENWKSKAGSQAVTTMYSLFNGNESRSAVIENYVNFLSKQVSPGYVSSETQNTKLADQFL